MCIRDRVETVPDFWYGRGLLAKSLLSVPAVVGIEPEYGCADFQNYAEQHDRTA